MLVEADCHAVQQYGSIRLDVEPPIPLDEFKALINAKYVERSIAIHCNYA